MDCLHGVLMHADTEEGKDHVEDDNYLRFKHVLGADDSKRGPDDPMTQLHGVLMHGDKDSGQIHDHMKATNKDESKVHIRPQNAEEYLHGVLMHGDKEAGTVHNHKKVAEEHAKVIGPLDAEEQLHGILMHGDSKQGIEHDHAQRNAPVKEVITGPKDLEDHLHGLMHEGGVPDKHHEKGAQAGQAFGPEDVEGYLHGLLHGGDDPEIRRHDDKKDEMRNILRNIDLDKINENDKKDFATWKREKKDAEDEGQSLSYISDSGMSDEDRAKVKYLAGLAKANEEEQRRKGVIVTVSDIVSTIVDYVSKHEHEDMRDDVDMIGSTLPLKKTHRVH